MSDHGGDSSAAGHIRRSRIWDYIEDSDASTTAGDAPAQEQSSPSTPSPPSPSAEQGPSPRTGSAHDSDQASLRRREAAALLGEFRRTAVLLPLGENGSPLTAEFGGIRWIYAFSDEATLARFAIVRGEGAQEWAYERVLGARLLDAAIPAMPVPCGVALDVGSEGEGALFPPVRGIVPDGAAVDVEGSEDVGPTDVHGTKEADENGEFAR
ncbi:hypothetical protein ACFYO0_38580 [Streptomyces sp. NPDC006365]|uniref:hypothetical protein n=1 Tax=Streptomyces sp. NPDC006365 TaxID=3364744 RepID=UPI0036C98C24